MGHRPAAVMRTAGSPRVAWALVLLRVALGVFLLMKATSKFGWLLDATPLVERLTGWAARPEVSRLSNAYAQMLLPGAPVFARLTLVGELGGGLALVAGFWTRPVALLAAGMVLNFHLATGGLLTVDFLSDGSGLVTVAALVTVALGGRGLPMSVAG